MKTKFLKFRNLTFAQKVEALEKIKESGFTLKDANKFEFEILESGKIGRCLDYGAFPEISI